MVRKKGRQMPPLFLCFTPTDDKLSTMSHATVAILRTQPSTVISDYHELMNLAGYRQVVDPSVDTALKVNISWHFFFPGCSTTPWQLDGVIRAMKQDGYNPALLHACHNRTVVILSLIHI